MGNSHYHYSARSSRDTMAKHHFLGTVAIKELFDASPVHGAEIDNGLNIKSDCAVARARAAATLWLRGHFLSFGGGTGHLIRTAYCVRCHDTTMCSLFSS